MTDLNSNLQLIQENMYNLYKMTPTELDPLLGQTYHRKEVGKSGVVYRETYACVVKVTPSDALRLYNRQYNELALTRHNLGGGRHQEPWQCLTVYSIDDGWWRAILPITEQPLSLLWSSILDVLKPTHQVFDWDNWERLRYKYFLEITEALGATEYDYD